MIANLKDEAAIRGVLWSSRGQWLTLRNAELLKPATPPTPIDGEVVVHRSHVAFIQVLP